MSGVVQRRNDLLTVTQRGLSLFKQIYDVYLYTLGTHEKSKRKPSGQFFQTSQFYVSISLVVIRNILRVVHRHSGDECFPQQS